MKLSDVEKNAIAFFESGFNCAESVSQAILEAFAEEGPTDIPRVASAFGGGIGGTQQGVCGALSGGIIAIGYLLGRVRPTENVDTAKAIAAEFREKYIALYATTNCGELLDKFEPQTNYAKCQEMVGKMAGVLARLLRDHGLKMRR
ncbi:C_GCAxxG_C_C family protein [candidate division KSB1 bacterium]|nr:C_GCAxxG_C_C family protein [candidate division KSB1 bacterium]RQW04826.1 MAG: C_GCAxxG_C_C family protein [candidate division KSB1 bacterium]